MTDAPKNRAVGYMAGVLIVAAIVTLTVEPSGINFVKIAGVVLAAVTVLPIFHLLAKRIKSGSPKKVLATFVIGFFYKLIVLMAGIWLGLSKAGWEVAGYTASCLAFVFAFQVCESLYFWANREVLNRA